MSIITLKYLGRDKLSRMTYIGNNNEYYKEISKYNYLVNKPTNLYCCGSKFSNEPIKKYNGESVVKI